MTVDKAIKCAMNSLPCGFEITIKIGPGYRKIQIKDKAKEWATVRVKNSRPFIEQILYLFAYAVSKEGDRRRQGYANPGQHSQTAG